MKPLKIMGLMLMALFALGAFTASAAMAVEEGVLPAASYTGSGGAQVLETLANEKIECSAVSILEGKFNTGSDDQGTANLHFTGCNAVILGGKFPANSLGDASGVILSKVNFTVCLVKSAELVFGIAITPVESPFHVEVPSVGALLLVKGTVIAELEGKGLKGKEFKYKLEGKEGDQKVALKCEALGKTFTHSYESALDSASKDEHASQNGKFSITFSQEVTLED